MTFEAGDIVRVKDTGQLGSVADCEFGIAVAMQYDTHFEYEIELVYHPDTVRLNYLIEHTLGVAQNDNGEYYIARAGIDGAGDYFIESASKTPRAAIDIAIKEELR